MKKIYVFLGVLLSILICFVAYKWWTRPKAKQPILQLSLMQHETNPSNYRQNRAKVVMGIYKGQFYFVPTDWWPFSHSLYREKICCITNNSIKIVGKLKGKSLFSYPVLIGFIDNYFYYTWEERFGYYNEKDKEIHAYNLDTGQDDIIFIGKYTPYPLVINNSLYLFPSRFSPDEKMDYMLINGECAEKVETSPPVYTIGDSLYCATDDYGIFKSKTDGIWEQVQQNNVNQAGVCSVLIPVKRGLLIHNLKIGQVLSLINLDEEIEPLFEIPCLLAETEVTVYNDFVFLSVKRYEGFDEYGYIKRFEDDEKEGLYRIDLNDYSVRKISSVIYQGLYILDSCLFACDEKCNIYQLDYEGNVITAVLSMQ